MPTETLLRIWRDGSINAERLCADCISIEGFSDVDPQSPLGGPDGKKDILCIRDGQRWVAAVYFPPTDSSFSEIKAKFEDDILGVAKNRANGFVFFSNQSISPGERNELHAIATKMNIINCEIYHVQRIRTILDSPKGYGIRQKYLRLEMTLEEQSAFIAQNTETVNKRLRSIEEAIARVSYQTQALSENIGLAELEASERKATVLEGSSSKISGNISLDLILLLHRACTIDRSIAISTGKFRQIKVAIGPPGATEETAKFVPCGPREVVEKLSNLLSNWNVKFIELESKSLPVKISAITEFHYGFLEIHPFMDGNGRVARLLMYQQVLDLVGDRDFISLDKGQTYYDSLECANKGDLAPLNELIEKAIMS